MIESPIQGNNRVRVLAVDPGISTGLAWLPWDGPIETTVAPNPAAVAEVIWRLRPEILVVEWFVTGQRLNQYSRTTIEICGGCEMLAYVIGARVIRHTPKHREKFLPAAERILIARWGPRGSLDHDGGVWTSHQQDAMGHALCYLNNHDVDTYRRLIGETT